MTDKMIVQIIPAEPGWYARYNDPDTQQLGAPDGWPDPIICWALVDKDGVRWVEGMVEAGGYVGLASNAENFFDCTFVPNSASSRQSEAEEA